jgi:BirA family biotin operon repressor/biotin-[acetyl-CoA-carboxylase] ligase
MMDNIPDRLDAVSLHTALIQHPFVNELAYHPRLGSTNDLAKERARQGASEGLLVIADEQSSGRGRRGRNWWAPAGSALLTSLLFRPPLPPTQTQQLTMLCALAAADAVAETTSLGVGLKWPNDLVIGGRKLAGLLTESAFQGDQLDFAVVGLGLNFNTDLADAPQFLAPATSLRIELGQPLDRLELLLAYLNGVARRYARLKTGTSPHKEWASRLSTLGQSVTAHLGDQTLSGLAQGVDADGALLLRAADGTVHRLLAADVSLRETTI